jgi:hypothetical protein
MGKPTRMGILAATVALMAGCPSAPQAVRETVVRQPVASPRAIAPAQVRSPVAPEPYGGQSPVPYYPGITPTDNPATGSAVARDPDAHVDLCPDCKPTTAPGPSVSPSFKYAGKGLYAGPFEMSPAGAVIHVEHVPQGKPGTFVMHLDSDDQREKNLVVDAAGAIDASFKFPGRRGPYAFFLQIEPLDDWQVKVYNLPASPSPTPTSKPSP